MIKEEDKLAVTYNKKCISQQNSFNYAWGLLMEQRFENFRNVIFSDISERTRFRQLVVNCMIATDFADPDLIVNSKERWDLAFSDTNEQEFDIVSETDSCNRKATMLIEHIVRISHVGYTMQPWQVYLKWNCRMFMECYDTYVNGRAEDDPSIHWYNKELEFFDNYVIPLARKSKSCNLFGKLNNEILDDAISNRYVSILQL